MTCIAAIVDDGKIYMAADSAITYRSSPRIIEGVVKIARKKVGDEECLIGLSGNSRNIQRGLYTFQLPPLPKDDSDEAIMGWLVGDVCSAIRSLLKKEVNLFQFWRKKRVRPRILLGFRQNLYEIGQDLTVLKLTDKYGAIGSGEAHAMGVLYATPSLEPRARLEKALEAAEHWNSNVRRPFHFLEL